MAAGVVVVVRACYLFAAAHRPARQCPTVGVLPGEVLPVEVLPVEVLAVEVLAVEVLAVEVLATARNVVPERVGTERIAAGGVAALEEAAALVPDRPVAVRLD